MLKNKSRILKISLLIIVLAIFSFWAYRTFSGVEAKKAYAKIQLPSDVTQQSCNYIAVPVDTYANLQCTATYASDTSIEANKIAQSLKVAGYTISKLDILEPTPGELKRNPQNPGRKAFLNAGNGTWELTLTLGLGDPQSKRFDVSFEKAGH